MQPFYSLDEIKIDLDKGTWLRAVKLYQEGKVGNFETQGPSFTAQVQGTHMYNVSVNHKDFDVGFCDCYLGQREILCKHMIAVAIYSLKQGKPLTEAEQQFVDHFEFVPDSNLDIDDPEQFIILKAQIKSALEYIAPYEGPSRIWFQYQDNLSKGCTKLHLILSRLPINPKTVKFILGLLLRIDRRLSSGGVDDSDGTVGDFIEQVVDALANASSAHPEIIPEFKRLLNRETTFGWEEKLVEIYKKHKSNK